MLAWGSHQSAVDQSAVDAAQQDVQPDSALLLSCSAPLLRFGMLGHACAHGMCSAAHEALCTMRGVTPSTGAPRGGRIRAATAGMSLP